MKYKIFLKAKEVERCPLATPAKVFNHVFSVISLCEFLCNSFTKKEWNYVF